MITKELVEQWAKELGCEIPSGPEGKEFFFYPDQLLAFAQRAAAYGAEQRERELLQVVALEPDVHGLHAFSESALRKAVAAARLQERTENFRVVAEQLSKAVEDARLQGAEEERKVTKTLKEALAVACIERDDALQASAVNQGLLEALKAVLQWIDDQCETTGFEVIEAQADAAIAAAEQEKTK